MTPPAHTRLVTQPDEIEALTVALRTDIDAVHEQVLAAIGAAATELYTLPVAARVKRLRDLETTLLALADQVDAIAARHVLAAVQGAYEIGAWATAIGVEGSASFAAVDLDAITHIADDAMDSLLHATKGMREDVKAIIRETVRDRVRAKVFTGQSATQAGRDLAVELAARGVTAVTYANGAKVSLPQYAAMVIRTKTAEAYQEGGMNQGERLGIEWWEVMDGPGCGWSSHDDPRKADGMIVPLATAREHPTSHPNCRRSTSPRPDITSAREAMDARPTTNRVVQEAQAQAVAAQQQARRAVARTTSRGARASAALDMQAGTVPPIAAAQRHAALLRRRA